MRRNALGKWQILYIFEELRVKKNIPTPPISEDDTATSHQFRLMWLFCVKQKKYVATKFPTFASVYFHIFQ